MAAWFQEIKKLSASDHRLRQLSVTECVVPLGLSATVADEREVNTPSRPQGGPDPAVTIVICTLGRIPELKRLLRSLELQSYTKLEVLLVDQSEDGKAGTLVRSMDLPFRLVRLRSRPGLSRARNTALPYVKGDIVAFPDDDCWYPPSLLADAVAFFLSHPDVAILCGMCRDEKGYPSAGAWDSRSGVVTKFNVWRRARSACLFVRRWAIEAIGLFDETLGVGAASPWRAGEETDYVLRGIQMGLKAYYEPRLVVYHPSRGREYDSEARRRAYAYGAGTGRVLRKHSYPVWFVSYVMGKSLAGAILSIARGQPRRAAYYWAAFRGQFMGWREPL